jgi:hypothetical protein
MRRLVIVLGVLALLGWWAWHLYQDPRVQDMFYGSKVTPAPRSTWRLKVEERPAVPRKQQTAAANANGKPQDKADPVPAQEPKQAVPAAESAAKEPPAPEPPPNSTPNNVVSRVVLQILAAKNLAYGIALTTTDTSIVVEGTVASNEKREQILAVLDKAREARRVDAKLLLVEPKKPPSA